MDNRISLRAGSIKPSATLSVTAKAGELRAAGRDILSLSAGEPDFDTPQHVKDAAVAAINAGQTKYTPVDGTPALKEAVIGKFERENQLRYQASEILVSCGAKHSIYNLMQATLNPGDEAIIPAPYWVSYPDMVRLAGAEPVIIRTSIDNNFKITAEQLRGALNAKTKLVTLNSPSNPTGVNYSPAELADLAAVLREFPNAMVLTDDIYEHILWTGDGFKNIVNVAPELADRTVVVNGVSKAYSMTGWRIGYAAGPAPVIAAMKKIQGQSTSNPTSISQAAAVAALAGDQGDIARNCQLFKDRHDYIVGRLNAIDGVSALPGDGTFYTFPDFSGVIERAGDIDDDVDLAEYLLEKAGVALVPGSAFGAPGCMRISFATSMEVLEQAADRVADALA